MTTSVTVKTVSWPVEVTRLEGKQEFVQRVEPNMTHMFYVHQDSELHIKELPAED